MKTLLIKTLMLFLLSFSMLQAQTKLTIDGILMDVQSNANLKVKGKVQITGNSSQNGLLNNDGVVELSKNWHNNVNYGDYRSTSGKVVFNGTQLQMIVGHLNNDYGDNDSFYDLEIDNASGVFLLDNTFVDGMLLFTNGKLDIGHSDLIFGDVTEVLGGDENNYIQTSASGRVHIPVWNNESFHVPLGRESYNPLIITNHSDEEIFKVKVKDEVLENGNAKDDQIVNRTWIIKGSSGRNDYDLDITVQWNTNEELIGFNRNACYLSHDIGNGWQGDEEGAALTLSGDNHTRTRNNVTALGSFAVGSDGTIPVEDVNKGSLKWYPNPASDRLNIIIPANIVDKANNIELINQNGQIVWSGQLLGAEEISIDLTNLNLVSGFYVLKVGNENNPPMIGKVMIIE